MTEDMRRLVSLLIILVALALLYGYQRGIVLPGTSSYGFRVHVLGGPDMPYVEAEKGEKADGTLLIAATHLASGTTFRNEQRVKKAVDLLWEKTSDEFLAGFYCAETKKRQYGERIGVEVELSYVELEHGVRKFDDHVKLLLPFFESRKETRGAFQYEASWKKD